MSGYYGEYYDLARRIEDTYPEIDSDACVDLRENDKEYAKLWMEARKLQNDFPAIEQTVEGNGRISLSGKEHTALTRYLELKNEMENMERKLVYLRGHTDNYAYLKMIGGIQIE